MIEKSFKEVHSEKWKQLHLVDPTHELVILRQVIPWQKLIDQLSKYYKNTGRLAKNLRMMIAVLLLGKLRKTSDQGSIEVVKENRYAQYFCNVSDEERSWFLERSTLVRFRQRLGPEGAQILEQLVFECLRQSGAIINDAALIDSTVLNNHLIHPNDVDLVYKAFAKMQAWAKSLKLKLWWDQERLKKRFRAYCLHKKQERQAFLLEFHTLFIKAAKPFEQRVWHCAEGVEKKRASIGSGYSRCLNVKTAKSSEESCTLRIV